MSATTAHSVVEPGTLSRRIAGGLVILYAVVSMIPLFWIFITGFKTDPPHDGRNHRQQKTKKPFTADELAERKMKKVS